MPQRRIGLSLVHALIASVLAITALTTSWFIIPELPLFRSAVLVATLAWLSLIDFDRQLLPNPLTLGLLLAGLALAALDGWANLLDSSIGAIVGFGFLTAVAMAYKAVKGVDGLGGGDAKLLGAAGAWLGWQSLPITILVASTLGLIVVLISRLLGLSQAQGGAIAFGPYLSLGIWFAWCLIHAT